MDFLAIPMTPSRAGSLPHWNALPPCGSEPAREGSISDSTKPPASLRQLIQVNLVRLHLIPGIRQLTGRCLDLQRAFDPVRLIQLVELHADLALDVHDLVRRWWRYVDAGTEVRHQQELR